MLPTFLPPSFASLRLVAPAKASRGHGGGVFTISVAASDPAAWEGKAPVLVGFVVCAEHHVAATGARGPLLCMRRESDSWTYGVVEGGAWTRVGALEDCKTCHATAERAPIFGPE